MGEDIGGTVYLEVDGPLAETAAIEALKLLQSRQMSVGEGLVALSIALVRLASPTELGEDAEVDAVQAVLDFVNTYSASSGGAVN